MAAIDPESISDRTTVGVLFRQVAKYGDRDVVHYRDGDGPWQALSWNDMRRRMLAVNPQLELADQRRRRSKRRA